MYEYLEQIVPTYTKYIRLKQVAFKKISEDHESLEEIQYEHIFTRLMDIFTGFGITTIKKYY